MGGDNNVSVVIVAVTLVAAVIAASYAPENWRLWGVDGLYGLSTGAKAVWIAGAGAAAWMITMLSRRSKSQRMGIGLPLGVIAAMVALILALPAATLLRGDGQLITRSSGEGSRFAPLYFLLAKTLAGIKPDPETVWRVFRWIDAVALLGYAGAWWTWLRDDTDNRHRALAVIAAFGLGSTPLLAGLVEHYALLHALLAWACVLVRRSKSRDFWRGIALLLVLLMSALNLQGAVILPAFVLLLPWWTDRTRWIAWAAVMAGAAVTATQLLPAHLLWPLGEKPPDGYTLFAPAHLLDLANLLVWTAPVMTSVLLPWIAGAKSSATSTENHEARPAFHLAAAMSALVFAVVFSPDLGMARDADLVSLWALPATFAALGYARRQRLSPAPWVIGAALAVAILTVGAQTVLQHDETRAVERHERELKRNPGRATYGWEVLGVHFRDKGDTDREYDAMQQAWNLSGNPRHAYRMAQIAAWARHDTDDALAMAEKAARAEPPLPAAQGFYGRLLLARQQKNEALVWLRKAIQNGSREDMDFVFLTDYYLGQGDISRASGLIEAGWRQAVNHSGPYYLMAGLVAERQGDNLRAREMFQEASRRHLDPYWSDRMRRAMDRLPEINE